MAKVRYQLTGGHMAFIHGVRVDLGETFELDEGEKPPRFSRVLSADEPAPELGVQVNPPITVDTTVEDAAKPRLSDAEPV